MGLRTQKSVSYSVPDGGTREGGRGRGGRATETGRGKGTRGKWGERRVGVGLNLCFILI